MNMTPDRLTELAAQSDGILYVMAVLLLIALTVIIDRFWFLGGTIRRGKRFTSTVAQFANLDRETLADLVEKSPRLPHRALPEVPLHHSELKDAHRSTHGAAGALAMSGKGSRSNHSISSIWPWPSPARSKSPCLIWPQ
ncbi:hypothetical protein H8A95_24365 [Bradyrhizobium sp. Pear76]|uniref:hypothetical protein n=1 Tax=Bradyrhizobium oropedii TaxID=1571201 RepID=UPI001E60F249|nr:hypothetical protein [Bradyrhizobium oropedii]MCC8965364.1 hypothetical protein [Bradyrhizobium oropedii]